MKKFFMIVLVLVGLVSAGKYYMEKNSISLPQPQSTEESGQSAGEFLRAIFSGRTTESPAPEAAEETEAAESPQAASQPAAEPPKPHTYQVVVADVSWEEAKNAAQEAGGYLAVITSQEEFTTIASQAESSGVRYLWLGAQSSGGQFTWLTGEEFTYQNWYPGEPSGTDSDGTPENYLCMWKVNGVWSFNDQRNDILSAGVSASGKIGYVIEYEQ